MSDEELLGLPGETITVMRSRFIGHIFRVDDAERARDAAKKMKNHDRKARHVAHAFRIEGNPVCEGMSDDGEPRATAGLPLLTLLRHHGLENVLVTVTRYYGGVNLGTGRLRRAYRDAAQSAIERL
jgi:putative IMPACT (imprinted ancient) family translation regulator